MFSYFREKSAFPIRFFYLKRVTVERGPLLDMLYQTQPQPQTSIPQGRKYFQPKGYSLALEYGFGKGSE